MVSRKAWLLLSLVILPLASCQSGISSDKLQIYASFFAMEDFAAKIGGKYAEVTSIVPSGQEIHEYEPTTGDIVDLSQADMFVYNGAGLEHFVDDLRGAIDNPDLVYVEASAGLTLISDGAEEDPHTWLSPINASTQIRNIADAIIALDPEHSDYYERNYDLYADKLYVLDQQFDAMLAPGLGKYLVTAHAAFGYLCREYGLVALPIGGHDAEQEPTQQDIADVIDIINENDIRYVYAESLSPEDAVLTVCEETGSTLAVLNPLEGLTDEEIATGEDCFSAMKDNLIAIARGFIEV